MINMPQIIKAQRDLMGQIAVTFKGDDGKEFEGIFPKCGPGFPGQARPAAAADTNEHWSAHPPRRFHVLPGMGDDR